MKPFSELRASFEKLALRKITLSRGKKLPFKIPACLNEDGDTLYQTIHIC